MLCYNLDSPLSVWKLVELLSCLLSRKWLEKQHQVIQVSQLFFKIMPFIYCWHWQKSNKLKNCKGKSLPAVILCTINFVKTSSIMLKEKRWIIAKNWPKSHKNSISRMLNANNISAREVMLFVSITLLFLQAGSKITSTSSRHQVHLAKEMTYAVI